jgi:hypothetical protein
MANLRKDFSNFMKKSYFNLDYRTIYKRLRNILRNSNNQEQELKEYVYTLMENLVQQNITFKNRIPTPKEVAKRRFPCPTAIKLCMDTIGLFKKMCVEIDPEFKSVTYFGLKQEDFSSIVNKEVNKTVMYDSVSEYMQREPYDLLVNDIDGIRKTIDGNTEYNDLSKKIK